MWIVLQRSNIKVTVIRAQEVIKGFCNKSMAVNTMNGFWIQFNSKATFNKNHLHGDNFERILPMVQAGILNR